MIVLTALVRQIRKVSIQVQVNNADIRVTKKILIIENRREISSQVRVEVKKDVSPKRIKIS